jgi:pyruvate formate lyase activating enzyme
VRQNQNGQIILTAYGLGTAFCIDPTEKKPLFHFYPGSSLLSFGTVGCNLGCKFCQNWSISKVHDELPRSQPALPELIAEAAGETGCRGVAFTYNDPVTWAEFVIDTARACRDRGLKTVVVTAGYIAAEARPAFFEGIDAANVDLKGFSEEFYQRLTLSHLQPVLDTLQWLKHETDVWLEVTTLIIPGRNNSPPEIRQMARWIRDELGAEVPWHLTAFHPDFRLRHLPPTSREAMLDAHSIALSEGLKHVYLGNLFDPLRQSTYCSHCGSLLIERFDYKLGTWGLTDGCCCHCGAKLAGYFTPEPELWDSRRRRFDATDFFTRRTE